jgi:putative inorganic carbon (HCO3(-)) transporter
VRPSVPSRRELWRAAVRLWRNHPLLGVGPDNFRHRYPEVIREGDGGRFEDQRIHANNLYFEVLANLGLAGMATLVLLSYGLWRAWKASLIGDVECLRLATFVAVGTFFFHGLFDYFLEFTPTFSLWWLLIALAAGPHPDEGVPSDVAIGTRAITIAPG